MAVGCFLGRLRVGFKMNILSKTCINSVVYRKIYY